MAGSCVRMRRRGFTLVELLVVMGIISVLVALLMPAVISAREAARRIECCNKMKQLALALHTYHTAHEAFPIGAVGIDPQTALYTTGYTATRLPFFIRLLPYIEQQNFYDKYDATKDWNAQAEEIRGLHLPAMQCPSDATYSIGHMATPDYKGNYGVNWGRNTYLDQGKRAPFYIEYGARLADIRDGTTNTLAMIEMLQAPSPKGATPEPVDRRGRIWNDDGGCYQITTKHEPNSSSPDNSRCNHQPDLDLPCVNSGVSGAAQQYLVARSRHPGGVLVSLCDGSVHFVSSSIDLATWQALSSIAGGEVAILP